MSTPDFYKKTNTNHTTDTRVISFSRIKALVSLMSVDCKKSMATGDYSGHQAY
jgi:hypothetical protein